MVRAVAEMVGWEAAAHSRRRLRPRAVPAPKAAAAAVCVCPRPAMVACSRRPRHAMARKKTHGARSVAEWSGAPRRPAELVLASCAPRWRRRRQRWRRRVRWCRWRSRRQRRRRRQLRSPSGRRTRSLSAPARSPTPFRVAEQTCSAPMRSLCAPLASRAAAPPRMPGSRACVRDARSRRRALQWRR